MNFHRPTPSTRGRRVRQQLRVTALFQTAEPKDGLFDGPTDGQEAVVLKQGRLFGSEDLGDVLAFLLGEDDAIELFVDDVVLVGNGSYQKS